MAFEEEVFLAGEARERGHGGWGFLVCLLVGFKGWGCLGF